MEKLVDYSLNQMSKYIFTCSLDKKDVKVLNSMSSFSVNKFWIEVIEAWCEYILMERLYFIRIGSMKE